MLRIAGVDEVGRGPLAGPVVTAAVILKGPIDGVKDSKKLSPKQRERLSLIIQQQALAFAFGRAEIHEIDALNIHHATLLAMRRAIEALPIQPDEILVDGKFTPPGLSIPARAIAKGDSLVEAIGAASILAKVCRDAEMLEMDKHYPQYGFAQHKGYPTPFHLAQLEKHGPSAIHRLNFAPVIASLRAVGETI